MEILEKLKFDEKGLVPAVTQDETGQVLMVAYMNEEAVRKTVETGLCHYYSRSRGKQWLKGETSGHVQKVREILYDCDADTLLIKVEQAGGACHTGRYSCFFTRVDGEGRVADEEASGKAFEAREIYSAAVLQELYDVVKERKATRPQGSYTASLFEAGLGRIREKVTEEALELVKASADEEGGKIVHEAADLLYHLLVLLAAREITPGDVFGELAARRERGKAR